MMMQKIRIMLNRICKTFKKKNIYNNYSNKNKINCFYKENIMNLLLMIHLNLKFDYM